jgi:siroheme synthase (precorrin-2 oxidase/ferrochelatase)
LAQRLRKELEVQFGPEYQRWLKHIGKVRQKMHARGLTVEARKRMLHELVSEEAFLRFQEETNRPPRKPRNR